jgi:acetyl esterase/lipase
LLTLAMIQSACVNYSANNQADTTLLRTSYQVFEDQLYTPAGWPQALYADVYKPAGEQLHPAVLVVHGGAWTRRHRDDMRCVSKQLAARGFVAVNISYRFAPEHQFPAQLYDMQQAMHWIHDNAATYRMDTNRIAALGYSSGAHLVSLLGLVAGTGDALDAPYGGELTRPAAVIAGGTPSDLRKFEGGTLVPQFLGGTLLEIPEVYADASPVLHIHDKAPPFFIYHGSIDMLVSADHATDFYQALQGAGVRSELYMMSLQGHVSAFLTSGLAVKEGMRFLQRVMPEKSSAVAL